MRLALDRALDPDESRSPVPRSMPVTIVTPIGTATSAPLCDSPRTGSPSRTTLMSSPDADTAPMLVAGVAPSRLPSAQ
jgi:hypothetical protein